MPDLIVVDITEYEKIRLNSKSESVDIKGDGIIIIKNPSKKSKLWNLNCDLKETVNTSIERRHLEVGTLNPTQEFTEEYEIHKLKRPSLEVIEIFDSDIKNEQHPNNAFLFNSDNRGRLKIILTNPLDIPMSNIKVHKNIPPFFQELEVIKPTNGNAGLLEEAGSKFLIWDVFTLEPKQKIELIVNYNINPFDTNEKPLGELNVTYSVNNHKLTLINPEVSGLTNSMSEIGREEGIESGIWDCSVEFVNESEFQIRLEEVKVSHRRSTGTEIVVSQTPRKLLNPEQLWNFRFKIESKSVPELISTIDFTPLFVVITRVIGEINKDALVYHVFSAPIEKDKKD